MSHSNDRAEVRTGCVMLVVVVAVVGYLVFFFFNTRERTVDTPVGLVIGGAVLALAIAWVIRGVKSAQRVAYVAVKLALTTAALIMLFATEYWGLGTCANFTEPLSHVDALYFSIGTLSTAGTGGIDATSEAARALQGAQMLFDLALVLFAIGTFVTRYMQNQDA